MQSKSSNCRFALIRSGVTLIYSAAFCSILQNADGIGCQNGEWHQQLQFMNNIEYAMHRYIYNGNDVGSSGAGDPCMRQPASLQLMTLVHTCMYWTMT